MKPRPSVSESVGSRAHDLRPIMRAMRTVVAALGQSARTVEQSTGVTNAQLFILRQLEREHSLSINDIAALTLTQQSGASVIVSRLERDGFVKRTRSREDARRVMVGITAAGRRLLEAAPPAPTGRLLEALRTLDGPELAVLEMGVTALANVLGGQGDEPMMMFEPPPRKRGRAEPHKG